MASALTLRRGAVRVRARQKKTALPLQRSGAALYRRWWVPLIWIAPMLIGEIVYGIYPFINTVIMSFTDAKPLGGPSDFVGLSNYVRLVHDPQFWDATKNSVLYALVTVPLLVVLPLILAQLVFKPIPGIAFFRSAFYTPVLASTVAVGLVWENMLSDQGPINTLLKDMHVIQHAVPFLSNTVLILFSAMALTVWKGLGWYMILYLAALGSVSPELYEAAQMDGAGPIRRFIYITVPEVRLTMLLVAIMAGIGSLQVFTEIYMLGGSTGGPGGGSRTLAFYIRDVALDPLSGNAGYGAAVSVVLLILTSGLAFASQKLGRDKV